MIGLIVLMNAYPPLGMAFLGLLNAGDQLFFSLFALQ